jgi:hypothetical protein
MKCLEIVWLRTLGMNRKEACQYMKYFCRIVKTHTLAKAHYYKHSSIPSDLVLVVTSHREKDKVMGTKLGSDLIEALKQYGMLDYNCWLEVEGDGQ